MSVVADELLSAQGLRARYAGLLRPDLVVMPVRHHSPACAWHLQRLFEQHRPSVVLVEGPRGFTAQCELLTHEDVRAPIAFYTYMVQKKAKDEPERRRAAYYPFCDYSPELVAFREARRLGIPGRFIDLDFSEQSLVDGTANDAEQDSLLAERHFPRSRHLQHLATQLGCRDHEELWEHLFEQNTASLSAADFIARVAAYCHLSRLDAPEAEMARDGTHPREAEMTWHVVDALKTRDSDAGPVLVVVGGFHAVVLPDLVASPPPRPAIDRTSISEENASLIRYGDERLERLNGYASGMTSPAWHQLLWERTLKHARHGKVSEARIRNEAALTILFDIAIELRQTHRVALPVPAVSAAYEQCLRLAQLRGRVGPLREDVRDAVTSCFVKGATDGDGQVVERVARDLLTGKRLGRVPAGAGTPPLLRDFQYRARRQRLKIDDTDSRRLVLDLYRRPEHRLTSRLLHGLALLAVPFATRMAGPDFVKGFGLERLQEHWEYRYSPITEGALVEAAMYGVTVPIAVATRFAAVIREREEQGKGRDARGAAQSLIEACVLGLHDHLPRILTSLRTAVNEDAHFDAVASAASSIGLLCSAREPLEARNEQELADVLLAAFERAVYLGQDLKGVTESKAPDVIQSLMKLRELLTSEAGQPLDASLFWAMVTRLRTFNDSPLLRGAAAGLLYCAGELDADALGLELKGHLDGMTRPRDAVGYMRGLTYTAREIAWQLPEFLGVLDGLLRDWDDAAFVSALPELRLAFAEMTPRETDRIAEAVASLHGEKTLGRLVHYDLDAEALQAHLELDRKVAAILSTDGLGHWLGASP